MKPLPRTLPIFSQAWGIWRYRYRQQTECFGRNIVLPSRLSIFAINPSLPSPSPWEMEPIWNLFRWLKHKRAQYPTAASHSVTELSSTCLNKVLKLFVLLELLKEAHGFFVMAAEFSVDLLHFTCIFFWKLSTFPRRFRNTPIMCTEERTWRFCVFPNIPSFPNTIIPLPPGTSEIKIKGNKVARADIAASYCPELIIKQPIIKPVL